MENKNSSYIKEALQKHSNTIFRIAYQNLKNQADAEDIMQEVFIRLMQSNMSFESDDHLKAWLIKVTINLCKDHLKSSWYKRTKSLEEIPNTYYLIKEESEVISELFKLSVKYRNILYLYYFEEYTLQEISQILDISVNTASSQLQRARKKLKFMMEGDKSNEFRNISECNQ